MLIFLFTGFIVGTGFGIYLLISFLDFVDKWKGGLK